MKCHRSSFGGGEWWEPQNGVRGGMLRVLLEPGSHFIVIADHNQAERTRLDKQKYDAQPARDTELKDARREPADSGTRVDVRLAEAFLQPARSGSAPPPVRHPCVAWPTAARRARVQPRSPLAVPSHRLAFSWAAFFSRFFSTRAISAVLRPYSWRA